MSCQYSTAPGAWTSGTPGSRRKNTGPTPGPFATLPVLAIALLSGPGCLLVNRGSQSPGTMVVAIVGFFLLYVGLRFLLGRLEAAGSATGRAPALIRFLGGVIAGLVIFLA